MTNTKIRKLKSEYERKKRKTLPASFFISGIIIGIFSAVLSASLYEHVLKKDLLLELFFDFIAILIIAGTIITFNKELDPLNKMEKEIRRLEQKEK